MEFSLKNTAVLQAVKLANRPIFRFAKLAGLLGLTAGLILFSLFCLSVIMDIFNENYLNQFLGSSLLGFSFGFLFLELGVFFTSKLAEPPLEYTLHDLILSPHYLNAACFLDLNVARACLKAFKIAKKNKRTEPGNQELLQALLARPFGQINFIFQRAEVEPSLLKKALRQRELGQSENHFAKIILEAARFADKHKKERITVGHILFALAENDPWFDQWLTNQDLSAKDLADLALWYERVKEKSGKKKHFWLKQTLREKGSLGRSFAAGYSITLDKYSSDITEKIKAQGVREIIGHNQEIQRVEDGLTKEEINNVLLVGEPGVGRESVFQAIAQKAFLGQASPELNYKRFLKFEPAKLAAQITSFEQTEKELDTCLAEAVRAGNIILLIDDFERFAGKNVRPGEINILGVLTRYLPLSSFQVVAITSYQGLHDILEKNSALLNLFEKIEVPEISHQKTLLFLENYLPFWEKRSGKFISYRALREVIELSGKYLTDSFFPEKAVRLIDEALVSLSSQKKKKLLTDEDIKKIVQEKTQIPLQKLAQEEKKTLLNLEKLLHQRIVNQEEAVSQTSAALRRARAEVRFRTGPMGSFLFLGPTGVGKTETAKALSAVYFGSPPHQTETGFTKLGAEGALPPLWCGGEEKRMIRLDMTEFQKIEDIARLIGSPEQTGLLTTPVRENPFSLVLLDELEKAHPNILHLFLQVLDEGWVTDGVGRKIDFSNTIIIATSNAGAELIRKDIQENKQLNMIKEDLMDELFKRGLFRPEFINRFDAVVVFKPLTPANLLQIAFLMLNKIREGLKDKGITLELTKSLQQKIVDLSYNPVFGAREMRRVLQDKVENVLANALLSGQIKRGQTAQINPETFEIIIVNKQENQESKVVS